jgi:SAM-dependent methyltransferase
MQEPSRHQEFSCRVCLQRTRCAVHPLAEMMYGTRESFDYAHCSSCGCLQIVDIPHDLGRHYPADYYSMAPRAEAPALSGIKRRVAQWYCRGAALRPAAPLGRLLRRALPVPTDFAAHGHYLVDSALRSADERILDVGCGASPYLLAAFKRCGFANVQGIDPFVGGDLNYQGVPVRRCTLDQVGGEFGLIMFNHSLEHVPDPLGTLQQAARLLRPGGTCLVRIPVMGTWFWRRFGRHWVELDAPRHLYLFEVKSLQRLAQSAGLVLRRTVFDSAAWELAASVRYEQGVSLKSSADVNDGFSAAELDGFARQARQLNADNDGGRACFYLERPLAGQRAPVSAQPAAAAAAAG